MQSTLFVYCPSERRRHRGARRWFRRAVPLSIMAPRPRRSTTGSIGYPARRLDYSLGEHVYDSFQSSFEGLLPALRTPSEALTGCFSRPRGPWHGVGDKALRTFLHPELRRGLRTWVRHVDARLANQRQLVQASRAMQAGSKGRAWRTWEASRLEHQLFLAFCARVVKRMLSSAAARAVHSWLAFVEQRRRRTRRARRRRRRTRQRVRLGVLGEGA